MKPTKAMKPIETVTLDQILELLHTYFGLRVKRPTIYTYMHKKNFPKNIGMGRPALWPRHLVMAWIKEQLDNNKG